MKIPIDYRTYILQESFGTWVVETVKLLHSRLLRNFKESGFGYVKLDQWRVMIQLWSNEGCCQNELSLNADKNQTYITRLLDKLEKDRLVIRVPHPEDRRAKQIYLTQSGRKLIKSLIEIAQKTLGEALNGIDEKDLNKFREVLEKVRINLRK